jgi:hypothetical protein
MEDLAGDGVADLRLIPSGITLAEAGGHKFAHGTVHAQSLAKAVCGGHGAKDREPLFFGGAEVIGGDGSAHGGGIMSLRWLEARQAAD